MDIEKVFLAAKDLFDNRLGWSDNRNPYGSRPLWANLGSTLYGEDDERVRELRPQPVGLPKVFRREQALRTEVTDKIDAIIKYLEDN